MSKKSGKTPGAAGYGHPPKHSRFKPGKSGNPSGRRKGQPSVEDLMLREAARLVRVSNGDREEMITKHEVVIRKLWNSAMHDDLAAQRLVLSYMASALLNPGGAGPSDEADAPSLPAKTDEEAIKRMLARFAHLQPQEETP